MDKMLGGDVIARMLHNEGVEVVFGIIDGSYFGLYASLRNYGIRLVTPRHEACAVHMAAAYARLTGRLGVAMASNGPGVANVLPGVAVENGEGNRVLLLTSTRRAPIGYPDRGGTYQYFNQAGVTKPMTKWSGRVPAAGRVQEFMKRAFRVSWRGRPGLVHVDIPEDILNNKMEVGGFPAPPSYRRTAPVVPAADEVQAAAQLLRAAKVPMVHAGSGVIHAGAFDELQAVAELLHAPVTTSWAARGALREDHELAIPMVHVQLNNTVRNEADAVLTLGSRIGETDWWGKPPYWRNPAEQRMVQVDIDEEILGLNKPAEVPVLGDIKLFLKALRDVLEREGAGDLAPRRQTVDKFRELRQKDRAKLDQALKDMEDPLNTAHVATICQEVFPEEAIYVIDGGNTAIWGNFFHEIRTPGTVLGTPKFGMLGAGVAQAIGAQVAYPDRPVYAIVGDGAMGFNQQEVETAVRNKLPVIYLVCVDNQWGMVKMNQQFTLKPLKTLIFKSLAEEETINADFSEVDYGKLAEAMGAHGERVRAPGDLRPAIARARESGKPAVIHIDVDPVKHMWAPSLIEFKKMHAEPKGK